MAKVTGLMRFWAEAGSGLAEWIIVAVAIAVSLVTLIAARFEWRKASGAATAALA